MKLHALVIAFALAFSPGLLAQNSGEVGAFFDYTRLANVSTNFYGVGGRIAFNMAKNVQLEAEMAYDFQRDLDCNSIGHGVTCFSSNTTLHMIHGAFGPKFQVGTGAVRAFFTLKGGLLNFSTSSSFPTQIDTIRGGDTNGVFYPGGGVELFAGRIGVRGEIGDEIWFNHGANHNLRITVGPQIRF
jgi:hypothetical protein